MIDVERVDHIGVRVADLDRALAFYEILGFRFEYAAENDAVAVVRNGRDVELNLVHNADNANGGRNVLMDVDHKYPGYTHVALRVGSIARTIEALGRNGVRITQGPVSFGRDGHVSVFVRDPDGNVVELRGRAEDPSSIAGLTDYENRN